VTFVDNEVVTTGTADASSGKFKDKNTVGVVDKRKAIGPFEFDVVGIVAAVDDSEALLPGDANGNDVVGVVVTTTEMISDELEFDIEDSVDVVGTLVTTLSGKFEPDGTVVDAMVPVAFEIDGVVDVEDTEGTTF